MIFVMKEFISIAAYCFHVPQIIYVFETNTPPICLEGCKLTVIMRLKATGQPRSCVSREHSKYPTGIIAFLCGLINAQYKLNYGLKSNEVVEMRLRFQIFSDLAYQIL